MVCFIQYIQAYTTYSYVALQVGSSIARRKFKYKGKRC